MGSGLVEAAARWMITAALAAVFGDRDPSSWLGAHAPFGGAPAIALETGEGPELEDGFMMERGPALEVVFGGADSLRGHVDRFYELHGAMEALRDSFSEDVQAALAAVTRADPPCPTEAIAPAYYRAHAARESFAALGRELELQSELIERLRAHGEDAAVTPEVRRRAAGASPRYAALLAEYREMEASLDDSVTPEASRLGCAIDELLREGERLSGGRPGGIAPEARAPASYAPARRPWRGPGEEAIGTEGSPVTFFVDNRKCEQPVELYVRGELLGRAEGGARAAFQTLAGRQSLCLLPEDAGASCGEAGTVRAAYIYDGWQTTLRCGDE